MKKMNIIRYPGQEQLDGIVRRPVNDKTELERICKTVFDEVKKEGDLALRKYTWHFDRVRPACLRVTEDELAEAGRKVDESLKQAILLAREHIADFHVLQKPGKIEYINENGFRCWQESRPIEKIGLYIPGGSAPLFSTVLMLAVPAQIAGCREIVLCTPPGKDGNIDPAILWTAGICGIKQLFKVGGIQSIAAMTYGTESVPKVDKIFGPGNQFVTAAKQWAACQGTAIDMPAGPSELLVVADENADPAFVAADLLSQAEHGPDSQVILLSCDEELIEQVCDEVAVQLHSLPRKNIAERALENSTVVLMKGKEECIHFINAYAPEHLMLSVRDYREWIPEIINAGSVFLGNYSPESAGDYASGTNHTLPTGGFARTYSGIGTDSFMKKISFQEITQEGLFYLAPSIEKMAEKEQLLAHKRAVSIRIGEIGRNESNK